MSRILVVDDNETMRSGITLVVERMEHAAIPAASGEEALARFDDGEIDLVISDYRMVEMDGLQLLEAVRQHHPETDVMIITAHGTIELAVDAMKLGAADFITKPFPPDALRLKIDRVLGHRAERRERQRLDEENRYLREEIGGRYGEIVGHSQVIREVLTTVDKVSAADSSVLIYGESGTGKELVARAIHDRSSRAQGAFVKVNCGSLPRGLVESELFGHEKGSFTGAVRQKKGKFELAEGGTVFLDEIGDIPQETPGEPPARPPGERIRPGGRRTHPRRRRPDRGGDKPSSQKDGGGGYLPRGSVLTGWTSYRFSCRLCASGPRTYHSSSTIFSTRNPGK